MASPVETTSTETCQDVLVLGATRPGLVAAQRLLRLGHPVVIADRGDVRQRASRDSMVATTSFVFGHPSTKVVDDAAMIDADGWSGDFDVTLASRDGVEKVHVGGILLAEDGTWEVLSIAPLCLSMPVNRLRRIAGSLLRYVD